MVVQVRNGVAEEFIRLWTNRDAGMMNIPRKKSMTIH